MKRKMKENIRNIIEGRNENGELIIPQGRYFDTHFIIDTIIKDYHDDYLRYAAQHLVKSKPTTTRAMDTTAHVHAEISKIIKYNQKCLGVQKVKDDSVSYSVRGQAVENALWQKL